MGTQWRAVVSWVFRNRQVFQNKVVEDGEAGPGVSPGPLRSEGPNSGISSHLMCVSSQLDPKRS